MTHSRSFNDPKLLENLASLHRVGTYDKERGRFESAHTTISKAYEIRLKQLGNENEDTIGCLDSLGKVLEKEGKWTEAETIHRKTLLLRKEIWG